MASRGLAPLSSRQENIMGLGRADGLRALKPGQRVVLGVLTENDQQNRVFGQVGVKCLQCCSQSVIKVTLLYRLFRFHPNMCQLFVMHLPLTSAHRGLRWVITWLSRSSHSPLNSHPHSYCRQSSC